MRTGNGEGAGNVGFGASLAVIADGRWWMCDLLERAMVSEYSGREVDDGELRDSRLMRCTGVIGADSIQGGRRTRLGKLELGGGKLGYGEGILEEESRLE
ncbi:unnamed protein product [Calypogeia fissa]